ncbi:MAG: DUF485 domain-containing protein [Candidatus Dormibacteraceae bacterium]
MTRAAQPLAGVSSGPAFGEFSDSRSMHGSQRGRYIDEQTGEPDFAALRSSPDFVRVRRRMLWFTFPMTVLFLSLYLAYILLSAYDHDFMGRKMFGEVNVGTVLGLLEFVSTLVIAFLYSRFARIIIDPQVRALQEKIGVGME